MSGSSSDTSNVDQGGKGLVIVYDGDCPFCSSYVQMARLRKVVGAVELIDARSSDPRVLEVQNMGYNLNEGFIVIYSGTTYYGANALVLLSRLSRNSGPIPKLLTRFFGEPERAHRLYPYLKGGRRLVLKLLGRPQISSPSGTE